MSEPRRLKGIAKGRKRKKEDPFPLSIDGSGAAHIFSIARFSARFPCRRSSFSVTAPPAHTDKPHMSFLSPAKNFPLRSPRACNKARLDAPSQQHFPKPIPRKETLGRLQAHSAPRSTPLQRAQIPPRGRRRGAAPRRLPRSARTQATTAARRPTLNTSANTTCRTTFRSPRRRSTVRWTPSGASA